MNSSNPSTQTEDSRRRFLAACRCEPLDRPPVWMMRQAGRALPEYRALKESHSFVEMVKTPGLAAEVTLQPVRRFGFDAAILFSDILVVPEALGQSYHFRETGGIEMEFTVRTAADIDRLDASRVAERLAYMGDALRLVKKSPECPALIGFAGSPWTLANFMIEGGGSRDWHMAKQLFYNEPLLFARLMEKLTTAVAACLHLQIDAGADAVQIFDTLGGLLAPEVFGEASARWMRQIVATIPSTTPVIVFSKGANGNWAMLLETGANVLGVDWTQPLGAVRERLPHNVGVQGNLDPALLCAAPEAAAAAARRILAEMHSLSRRSGLHGHIFNLGHGVTPDARLESIGAVVETVKNFP